MSRRPLAVAALVAATSLAFTTPPIPGSGLLEPGAVTADAPLVADGGASTYVAPGEPAVLLGTAFGGSGEYTSVAWSSADPAVQEAIEDPTNPTAVVDTAGLAGGTHEATLTVTDSEGETATDTVLFEVAGGEAGAPVTLFEETVEDLEPGTFAANAERLFPFDVPAGVAQLDAAIEWSIPANDYDLQLVDPSGAQVASSGNAPPATREATGVADPKPGEWNVRVERWLTVAARRSRSP